MEECGGLPTEIFVNSFEQLAFKQTPVLTFGEKLVGLSFNPSNDDKVSKAKRLCADLADLLYEENNINPTTHLREILLQHSFGSILDAQMNVVKVLTLKY